MATAVTALCALLCAAFLTGIVRRRALASGLLDIPNARSSHSLPTPRGGGISIVIVTFGGLASLWGFGVIDLSLFVALAGGGIAVAAVGFFDDRTPLTAGSRLIVHIGAALWALAWLGGLPPLQFGATVFTFGWLGYVLGVLGIVWTLNLFNFMDGIDGLAASEAVFIGWAGAAAALLAGQRVLAAAALVFGAACGGFLGWNLPRAKIFMGDVGSGFLGYVVAVLALAAARDNPVGLLVWLILGGFFFVDATVTFIRRICRGESPSEPHRSHAYQWLSRTWRSHGRVTGLALAINVLWLLPWAMAASHHPTYAGWFVLVALTPLVVLALLAGSGRRESVGPS